MKYTDVQAACIEFCDSYINGYDKEYLVSLLSDMTLWIEPAWCEKNEYHEAGYMEYLADVLFISGEANSSILGKQANPDCHYIEIDIDGLDCYDDEDKSRLEEDVISILDLIVKHNKENCNVSAKDSVIEFINRRFPNDSNWCTENCYYFALILKDRFPNGAIYYDVIHGHFVFKLNGKYYDHTGIVSYGDWYLVEWEKFDEYDKLQKKVIIRDCLK